MQQQMRQQQLQHQQQMQQQTQRQQLQMQQLIAQMRAAPPQQPPQPQLVEEKKRGRGRPPGSKNKSSSTVSCAGMEVDLEYHLENIPYGIGAEDRNPDKREDQALFDLDRKEEEQGEDVYWRSSLEEHETGPMRKRIAWLMYLICRDRKVSDPHMAERVYVKWLEANYAPAHEIAEAKKTFNWFHKCFLDVEAKKPGQHIVSVVVSYEHGRNSPAFGTPFNGIYGPPENVLEAPTIEEVRGKGIEAKTAYEEFVKLSLLMYERHRTKLKFGFEPTDLQCCELWVQVAREEMVLIANNKESPGYLYNYERRLHVKLDHKQLRSKVAEMLNQCRFRQRVLFGSFQAFSKFVKKVTSSGGASAIHGFVCGEMNRDVEFEKKIDNAIPTLFPLADGKVIDLEELSISDREKKHLFSITTQREIGFPLYWNQEHHKFVPVRWDKEEQRHVWLHHDESGVWDDRYSQQLREFREYVQKEGANLWKLDEKGQPTTHKFAEYLHRLFPNAWRHHEKLFVELDQKLFYWIIKGYGLTADMQDRHCYFLFGPGSNGKSAELKLMRACMDEFYNQATKHVIVKAQQQKANESAPHLEACKKKRAVAVPETDKGDRVNSGQLKSMCSGGEDAIQSRNLFQIMDMWDPYMKLYVACNYEVLVENDDGGMRDRTVCVNFNSRFYEDNMDSSNLAPVPPEELKQGPHFNEDDWVDPKTNLRWIKITSATSAHYKRMRKEHLNEYFAFLCAGACLAMHMIKEFGRIQMPECVKMYTKRFLDASDQLALLINDCMVKLPTLDGGDGFNAVWFVYQAWLKESNRSFGYNRQTFRDRLIRNRLYDAKKQGGIYKTRLQIDETKLKEHFPETWNRFQSYKRELQRVKDTEQAETTRKTQHLWNQQQNLSQMARGKRKAHDSEREDVECK
jgi:phage/plasmid-associated DNA primase